MSRNPNPLPPTADRKVYLALALLGGLFAAGTFAINLWRYETYRSAWPLDLAFFNHQLWNLWHGMAPLTLRPVNYYAIEGPEPWRMAQMRLAALALAIPYRLWPGVPMLLAAQSVACGFGVWPMYRIAARRSQSPSYGLLAAGAYVLAAPLWLLATTDFRPITLSVPFVLMAIDALDARSARRFLPWSVLALCHREVLTVALAAAAFALAFRRGEDRATKLRWIVGPVALSAAWMGLFLLFLSVMQGPESVGTYLRGMRDPESVGSRMEHPIRDTLAYEWPGIVKYQLPLVVAGLAAPELAVVGLALNYPPLAMGQWSLRPSQHFVRYTASSTMLLLAAVAIGLGRIGARRGARARDGGTPRDMAGRGASHRGSTLWNRVLPVAAIALVAAWLAASTGCFYVESRGLPSRFSRSDRDLLRQTVAQSHAADSVMAPFNVLAPFSSRVRLFAYEQLPGSRPHEAFSYDAFDRALAESDWCIIERRRPLLERRVKATGQFRKIAEGERISVYRRSTPPHGS